MIPPSLYLLITGFGTPNWDHKVKILKNNLEKLGKIQWSKLKITVCQYSDKNMFMIPQDLIDKYNIHVIYEKGIVGEYIIRHASDELIKEYDYIMLLLDDVELLELDFLKMIKYYNDFSFDILSPCLSTDSKYQYEYMITSPNNVDINVVNVCEYFCLLFSTQNFKKYYIHLYPDNQWMWGLDLVLKKHLQMKVGLLNKMTVKHWFKNESYNLVEPYVDPLLGLNSFLKRFNETTHGVILQKAVEYYIIESK